MKASKVPNTAGCEEKCKVPNTTSLDNSVSHSEDLGSSSSSSSSPPPSSSLVPSANSIGTRPLDISQHKDDPLARPQCQFKVTSFGKKGKQRGFSKLWYSSFEWVEYSASAHQAFCFPCSHFGIEPEPSFTVSGYHNWKHGLKPHCDTRSHHSAMIAWKEYQSVRSKGGIISSLDNGHAKVVEQRRSWLKLVVRIVRHCAIQEIALRGHREHSEHDNRGNFLETCDLVLQHADRMREIRSSVPDNAHYCSPESQNQLLNCMAKLIQKEIVQEATIAKYWSLTCDECRDTSKREQLAIGIRYWIKDAPQEASIKDEFLAFTPLQTMNAPAIFGVLNSNIERLGLVWDNLVGQCYDGASVMSGHTGGLQALVRQRAPQAIYIHCWAHRLNLSLLDTCCAIKELSVFFQSLEELYVFMSSAVPHASFVSAQVVVQPGEQMSSHT